MLNDAGLNDGGIIESGWFGIAVCGPMVRGVFAPGLSDANVREGLFPERVPIVNVEGGCATASMALNGAWKDIASGVTDVSIAFGVEKLFLMHR